MCPRLFSRFVLFLLTYLLSCLPTGEGCSFLFLSGAEYEFEFVLEVGLSFELEELVFGEFAEDFGDDIWS